MERVITSEQVDRHRIEKYRFKTLIPEENQEPEKGGIQPYRFPELQDISDEPQHESPSEDSSAQDHDKAAEEPLEASQPDPAFEEMLKRVDELSSELVKTQMQLEKAETACEERMKEAKEEGYGEGLEAGKKECDTRLQQELGAIHQRLESSIKALEESRQAFLQKIESVEADLIETALDLAKEVIVKEISKDSREIALRLARLLLAEVKDAAKITLRVNPDDFEYLRDNLQKREGLDIVSDPAVGPGGVVIVSDLGEIDGEIMHRFERIKEAVFGPTR